MKTITEIGAWCDSVGMEFGDPAEKVGQIFARYVAAEVPGDEILAHWENETLALRLGHSEWLPLNVHDDGPLINRETHSLVAFGLEKIGDHIWTLTPSLNMPGTIHVFVVIFDVPLPAPWERRIILPYEFAAATGRRF